MGFNPRLACLADLDALCEIDDLVFGGPTRSPMDRTGRRQFRYQLTRAHAEIYIAELDGRIVGFASVLMRTGSVVVRGYSLAILPEVQACGVATAFFQWAERRWADAGYHRASFEVHVDNQGAQRLYSRLGYSVKEHMVDYFGPGDDGLRMVKCLVAG